MKGIFFVTCNMRKLLALMVLLMGTNLSAKKFKIFQDIDVFTGYGYYQATLVDAAIDFDDKLTGFAPNVGIRVHFFPPSWVKLGLTCSLGMMDTLTGDIDKEGEGFYSFEIKPKFYGMKSWHLNSGLDIMIPFNLSKIKFIKFFRKMKKIEFALRGEAGLMLGTADTSVTFAKNDSTQAESLYGAKLQAEMQALGQYWQADLTTSWIIKKKFKLGITMGYRRVMSYIIGSKVPLLLDRPKSINVSEVVYDEDIETLAVYKNLNTILLLLNFKWTLAKR